MQFILYRLIEFFGFKLNSTEFSYVLIVETYSIELVHSSTT